MPTPRLPVVGQDNDAWGGVLNEYLSVSLNADGTLKETFLVCKGFLTQTGTGAPSFTSIKDTLLGTWARTAVGTYTLTKTGAFTLNKTVPIDDIYTDQAGNLFKINRTSADVITLLTYAAVNTAVLADSVLSNRYINIEIYN
ncbi:MAG: hypothetical protein NTU81_02220 [Candidatus Nomurabacteria bacterium]|nr:hypothetical protein [Candidatus Nomurabacteria bacterium]